LKAERSGRKKLPAGFAPLTSTATAALGTPTAAAAKPAAAAAFRFRARFVDVQRPAVQIVAIQGRDGPIRLRSVGHFDESESTRTASLTVGYQVNSVHTAVWLEK
jgi:hypothetical protein